MYKYTQPYFNATEVPTPVIKNIPVEVYIQKYGHPKTIGWFDTDFGGMSAEISPQDAIEDENYFDEPMNIISLGNFARYEWEFGIGKDISGKLRFWVADNETAKKARRKYPQFNFDVATFGWPQMFDTDGFDKTRLTPSQVVFLMQMKEYYISIFSKKIIGKTFTVGDGNYSGRAGRNRGIENVEKITIGSIDDLKKLGGNGKIIFK